MAEQAVARSAGELRNRITGAITWPALGAVLCWTAMSPFAKWALQEVPALAYTALRPAIAVVALYAVLWLRKHSLAVDPQDRRRLIMAGIFGMGLSQLFFISGLARTSVTHNVILVSCSPLLVAGYRWFIKRESIDPRSALGVLGGFAGVVLLVSGAGASSGATLLGDLLSLGAAIAWMGATIWPSPLLAKYGTLTTTTWMLSASLLLLFPIGIPSILDMFEDQPSLPAWGSLVYSGIFGVLIGNSLWQRAVQQVGASRTLIYLYLEPVGALILAALFLGERLSALQALGGVLALAGVALVRKT